MDDIERITGKKMVIRSSNLRIKKQSKKWVVVCNHYLNLYSMCKAFRSLPESGGIEDQDNLTMYYFDIIDGVINKCTAPKVK